MAAYIWGTREVYSNGYVRDKIRTGQPDARARVEDFRRRKEQGQEPPEIRDVRLIRRPVGEWEEVN